MTLKLVLAEVNVLFPSFSTSSIMSSSTGGHSGTLYQSFLENVEPEGVAMGDATCPGTESLVPDPESTVSEAADDGGRPHVQAWRSGICLRKRCQDFCRHC